MKTSPQLSLLPPAEPLKPIWLSVSEAAKLGGVQSKTIRRGIEAGNLKFKVIGNRYLINLATLITWLLSNTKLRNKFLNQGLGQYVSQWKRPNDPEIQKEPA